MTWPQITWPYWTLPPSPLRRRRLSLGCVFWAKTPFPLKESTRKSVLEYIVLQGITSFPCPNCKICCSRNTKSCKKNGNSLQILAMPCKENAFHLQGSWSNRCFPCKTLYSGSTRVNIETDECRCCVRPPTRPNTCWSPNQRSLPTPPLCPIVSFFCPIPRHSSSFLSVFSPTPPSLYFAQLWRLSTPRIFSTVSEPSNHNFGHNCWDVLTQCHIHHRQAIRISYQSNCRNC